MNRQYSDVIGHHNQSQIKYFQTNSQTEELEPRRRYSLNKEEDTRRHVGRANGTGNWEEEEQHTFLNNKKDGRKDYEKKKNARLSEDDKRKAVARKNEDWGRQGQRGALLPYNSSR